MDELRAAIARKKAELDRLRGHAPGSLVDREHAHDFELTYTSNAIEGNTLSAAETMLVIEQGITIGGKPLKDHLEALDHFDALRFVRILASENSPLNEADIRNLHRLVVQRSNPEIAGRYADRGRFVATDTGRHAFPSPAEVPALMGDFAHWLAAAPATPETAFTAHRRLVDLHPLNDGNGRTARLLMNLVLLRAGYPPVAVRPEDRPAYIAALQDAQGGRGAEGFDRLLYERLDATLDDYVRAPGKRWPCASRRRSGRARTKAARRTPVRAGPRSTPRNRSSAATGKARASQAWSTDCRQRRRRRWPACRHTP
jgi:Fic family protein